MHEHEPKPRLSRRLGRVASRIKFLVAEVIRRELNDPRIGFITVLDVEPTEDLKEAKVYVSVLGSKGDRSKAQHALESARGFIQREVGRNLSTRNTPVLRFIFDDSQDKVSRIEALLEQVKSGGSREETMAKKPSKKPERPESDKPEKGGAKKGEGKGKHAFDEDEELEDLDLDEGEDLGVEEDEGLGEEVEEEEEEGFEEEEDIGEFDEEEEEEEEEEEYEDIDEDYEDVDGEGAEEEEEDYEEDYEDDADGYDEEEEVEDEED